MLADRRGVFVVGLEGHHGRWLLSSRLRARAVCERRIVNRDLLWPYEGTSRIGVRNADVSLVLELHFVA